MYNIKGEIKMIGETAQITEKFKKREFVIIDNSSQYPQFINFQLTQDRCELITRFMVGQQVCINFNIRGKEWVDKKGEIKYFNSLDVWQIESEAEKSTVPIPLTPDFLDTEEDDILPF